ncbi:MAG: aldo/keto reductase [Caldisericaceae bacterium]
MDLRKFGKTDEYLFPLGFGTMRLPTLNNDNSLINEPEAIKMIRYAIDNGLNYVDTAFPYHGGNSEILVGKALKDGYRKKTNIATKLPTWLIYNKKDLDKYFFEQLKKLQTDYVDFYLLHTLDKDLFEKMKNVDAFTWAEKKIKEGLIRYFGFSFHDEFPVFKEIVDYYPNFNFAQIQLNYLDTEYQAGLKGLKYANEKGLAVVIMEPLRGGELTNLPKEVVEIFSNVNKNKSIVEWAFDYLWNMKEVSVVLSGMSTFKQVEENLGFARRSYIGMLTQEEKEVYKRARDLILHLRPVGCTGCGYCYPCSVDIDIPGVFDIYNKGYLFSNISLAKKRYSSLKVNADACIECKICESKCPQNLPISQLMKKIHMELSNE